MQANEIKKGVTFRMDEKLYLVIDFQHVQQPRMAAFVRAKLKNVETGQVIEKRFNTGDRIDEVTLEKIEMQYIYNDGDMYYFMNVESYEQMPLDKETCGSALDYIKDGMTCFVKICGDKVISVEPPLFVELQIVECDPAVLGDTQKNSYKPAKLETGLWIKVPMFVNNGDTIKIYTRTGEYLSRV